MSIAITEKDLPASLTPEQAVESAYSQELADIASKLVRGLPVLVECDKELAPAFIRERLSTSLPKYMLPTVFNWMELMPRNPNGKIDRAQLVARAN